MRWWALGCGVALLAGAGVGLLVGGGEERADPGAPIVRTLGQPRVAPPGAASLRAGTTPTVAAAASAAQGPSGVVAPPAVPAPPPPGASTFTIDDGAG